MDFCSNLQRQGFFAQGIQPRIKITTPERWKEIDRIFAAALELEPAARTAFLNEACGSDEELRKEVESLRANDLPESLPVGRPSTKPLDCYR